MKTSLTAFRVGGRRTAPELADLAASIQRVAREASAITQARAEVESLIAAPYGSRESRDEPERGSQSVGG